MSAAGATLPLPVLSDEVRAFAAEKGVAQYLPAIVEMTRRVFPTAEIRIEVKDDPELSYNREIAFRVTKEYRSSAEFREDQRRWTSELIELCPATHVHAFTLLLRSST